MKIAFAIEHFDARHGGAERYAWGLGNWLVAEGHELHIYTSHRPEAPVGMHVHVLDLSRVTPGDRRAQFAEALTQALEGEDFDVVQGFNHVRPCDVLRLGGGVHLAYERYNALAEGNPLVTWGKRVAQKILPRYRALRVNEALQFADANCHFIAVAQRVADDMAHYYPASRTRTHVVRNALDLSLYNVEQASAERDKVRDELGLSREALVFLFASNNYQLKGLSDILFALYAARTRLPKDYKLLVVGRDKKSSFVRQACQLGISEHVRFCGSASSLLGYYGASDALLHPTYYDACANVCLEAMACGLPVLTSTNNGGSECVKGEGSILVTMPCDTHELADAIVRLGDGDFRDRAREVQVARAEQMPVERNYRAMLSIYKELASWKRSNQDVTNES